MVKELTEQEYNNFLSEQRKWEYYSNFKKYLNEHSEETFEYLCLHPSETGLKVDIAIDDEASFVKNNHPLWLYFDNGEHMKNRIPVSISLNPQILTNEKINVSKATINGIKKFIKKNYNILIEYGYGNIGVLEFYGSIKENTMLLEHTLICEMPVLNKKITGLNTLIWVDNTRVKQHGNRIKFKYDEDNNTNNWATMTIDDENPVVKNMNRRQKISDKDINNIKQFVIYNYDILSQMADDNTMKYETDFLPYVIKIGEHGGMIVPQARLSKTIQPSDDAIKIECSLFDDKLYFFVKDKNDISKLLINKLIQNNIFQKYNDYGVFTKYDSIKIQQGYGYKLLGLVKEIATENNIKIQFINTNNIL